MDGSILSIWLPELFVSQGLTPAVWPSGWTLS